MGYYSYEVGDRTAKERIDALIDWYETHRPGAGTRIPVNYSAESIRQALKEHAIKQDDGSFLYRNRLLISARSRA